MLTFGHLARLLTCWVALLISLPLFAAETIPTKPENHFNDYAGVVGQQVEQQLNGQLAQFERDTSSQLVVAVFRKMQTDSSIEDYTQRVAQNWGVGTKEKNNGAVLFVFIDDRQMYMQVGYGLEGAIPDALAKRIIADEITPHFKAGDFSGGLSAGVNAMIQAAKGEYKGTGRTVREGQGGGKRMPPLFIIFIIIMFIISMAWSSSARHGGTMYSGRGRRRYTGPIFVGGGWGGGGGFGGGGGGGGSFSGGGGSFGGGGAGGSW